MYGGLFGDLPSTKKSQSSDNKETTSVAAGGANQSQPAPPQNAKQDSTNDDAASKNRPASLVDKLGTAGTTMAFVPAALRNRKRVNSALVPPPAKLSSAKMPPPTAASQATVATEQSKPINQTTIKEQPTSVSHIHDNITSNEPTIDQEEESEAMRLLHASVVDPYDPHVPNDLLAYWDRKAMERERLELEREAKETLKRQERLRQQLEQERQSLEKSGNLQELVLHRQQTSMGRGRGVSNLPAWLVQKQKEEALGKGGIAAAVREKNSECTVILSNLTAPGSIDEELGEEVKEECEEQCGPVTSVVVKDANPPHQPVVQVHVEFGNRGDAEKAVRVFHGRKFGQRRITAEFVQL